VAWNNAYRKIFNVYCRERVLNRCNFIVSASQFLTWFVSVEFYFWWKPAVSENIVLRSLVACCKSSFTALLELDGFCVHDILDLCSMSIARFWAIFEQMVCHAVFLTDACVTFSMFFQYFSIVVFCMWCVCVCVCVFLLPFLDCPYTLQWDAHSPLKTAPSQKGGSGLHYGSLGPPVSSTQMAYRSVQPFLQGTLVCQTDRPTDRQTDRQTRLLGR